MKKMFKLFLFLLLALPLLVLAAGQLGLLRGQQPNDLGVTDGRLKGLSATPNCASSQAGLYPDHAQQSYSAIDPLPLKKGDAATSIAALNQVLQNTAGIAVMKKEADYLYAQAETRWLKFTDDVEFWVNPATQVIEMRSASRLGRKDLSANRIRLEAVRTAYMAAP
jgi:uncharacterized protein (DUF1499 family)